VITSEIDGRLAGRAPIMSTDPPGLPNHVSSYVDSVAKHCLREEPYLRRKRRNLTSRNRPSLTAEEEKGIGTGPRKTPFRKFLLGELPVILSLRPARYPGLWRALPTLL